MEEELAALGVAADAVAGIVAATQAASLPELEALLGHGHEVRVSSPYLHIHAVPACGTAGAMTLAKGLLSPAS